ncbi:polyadenylate-binding protein-interacting protein 8-like isoform X2 [Durio zibethinus]|uniref:Polyadenylate-binding protein-interacting protein 8-like isoform X2 n=1 Tax=Durio zibethinus TaxID=66656 RepID=A0A6P5ZAD2_DURZI|nr:polyadenylate-binding protein-interacting protein 8-like isoform X2 [Durio zibethinus]
MAALVDKAGEAVAAAANDNSNLVVETAKSESKEFNVQKLVDMFTKLNPLAKEFFPSSYQTDNNNFNQVVDCRVCGDLHSILRFAFVEFADEEGARAALNLGGTMLGFYPVRVLPSKTAILPVNPTFLPRSEDERELCTRTVYCTNIDKKVSQAEVRSFFESACGEVTRLRLLGDRVHSTRIAFVEFAMAECAIIALNCSGMVLGTQPIRVSPSKTPVRPRVTRPTLH